jgi:hypothetical protein
MSFKTDGDREEAIPHNGSGSRVAAKCGYEKRPITGIVIQSAV